MSSLRVIAVLLFLLAPTLAEDEPPPVRVERVREILDSARPHLLAVTGLAWPEKLEVTRTDIAGLEALLLAEYRGQVDSLHPGRSAAARDHLARVLARSYARVIRAKYGLGTKKVHVAPGALARLAEGIDPDHALVHLVVHEAVHALDDHAADLNRLVAGTSDREARRALSMVIEGRAEHYGSLASRRLKIPPEVGDAFVAGRDPGERLLRDAGRRFVAALAERDPALPLQALKHPPRSTSTIFHPERYGEEPTPPDLVKPLARAGLGRPPENLSELLLRKRFGERLAAPDVEKTFSGFLAGAAVQTPDGRRVSLVALTDSASAGSFLHGIRSFEGVPEGSARVELTAPGGRRFVWCALARGRWVAEVVVARGADPEALAKSVLAACSH